VSQAKSHIGEIKKVEVVEFPFKSWGEFYYCETAIKKDESNGYIINIK